VLFWNLQMKPGDEISPDLLFASLLTLQRNLN
jgi:hypothetical protein